MKHALRAVAAGFIVAVAILLLSFSAYFLQLNSTAYDFTLRIAGPIIPTSPTLIVAIDEDSLERVGNWPWTRDKYASLIENVQAGSPKVIGVDLLLDEATTEEADNALALAISHSPSIVLASHLVSDNGDGHWRNPSDRFLQRHVRIGHVHADPDFDSICRRIDTVKLGAGRAIRAFAIEVLRGAGFQEKGDFDTSDGVVSIIRPETVNIRFVGDNNTFREIPAWQVLDGSISPDVFEDNIVLIGSTAEALGDQWFTPFAETYRKMSGVEIHANAIETLFAGRSISEVSVWIELLGLWALIMLLWGLDSRFEGRPVYAAAISVAPAVGIMFVSWVLMKYAYVWLPFPPFLTAIVVVVPGLEVRKIIRVNRDLDRKIQRLTAAALYERRGGGDKPPLHDEAVQRIIAAVPDGPEREGWLQSLSTYEKESLVLGSNREKLFQQQRHNSRWKLDAVDYFNEELMRFLSFNNAILASITDVILVSDPAGRVVYQNPAAAGLDGYQEDPPFATEYVASLLNGRGFAVEFASVIATGQPFNVEFIPGRGGRNFYNLSITPIGRSGVVLSLHDATAQFELNQAKSDMVSLVSHELRTPLTAIRGYSDMLQKYELVKEKGKEALETIIEETGRLNQLIQSFLDIAYIESGRQKISKTEFEVAPVLRDMLSVVGPVASEKKINLETSNTDDVKRVLADRLLMYQALTNLVTNAIKYSATGTTIRIGVANGRGRIRFQVADQGYGIPPEEQSKIFEKFYRRGNKETRDQSGFGLGLAFVKEVANRHGGDVVVESEVGKGSTFTLWIPNRNE
jgi:signal transduction histidine kinase/CHASE2 domain-containing sensor protein